MKIRPRWTRSKTQIFGVLLMVLGALHANMGIFKGWLTPEVVGWLGSGIGIAIYILRIYTTSPLSDKEPNREEK